MNIAIHKLFQEAIERGFCTVYSTDEVINHAIDLVRADVR